MALPLDKSFRQPSFTYKSWKTNSPPPPRLENLQHPLLLRQTPDSIHRLEQPRYSNRPLPLDGPNSNQCQRTHTLANNVSHKSYRRIARHFLVQHAAARDDTRLLRALRLRGRRLCLLASSAGESRRHGTWAGVPVDCECDGGSLGKAFGVAG